MFDIGFAEIFLLGVIGLMVLGPEKLPAVARTLGGLVRRARSSWFSLRRSIEAELAAAELADPIKDTVNEIKQAGSEVNQALRQMDEYIVDPEGNDKLLTENRATNTQPATAQPNDKPDHGSD